MTSVLERILVPLDGSRLAEAILPLTVGLAQACDAEIILHYVLESEPPEQVHGEPHLTSAEAANRYLAQLRQRLSPYNVPLRNLVVAAPSSGRYRERSLSNGGSVAACIAQEAQELGAQIVVLTTHGRSGLRGLLFRHIAENVLQQAERPTLVLRATRSLPLDPFKPVRPQRLLVPLDGSPQSEGALPWAWELGRCLGATVTLVRIVPARERLSLAESATAVFLPAATTALLELELEQAREALERLARTARVSRLAVQTTVRQGAIIEELERFASTHDLILLVTRGRAGLSGRLSGSVAVRLLSRVSVPLLMIPLPAS